MRVSPAPGADFTGELHRIPADCRDHQQHGAVCVLAAPALAALPAVVALNAAVSLALLVLAVRAFPPPPIVTMLVATACFGAALVVG